MCDPESLCPCFYVCACVLCMWAFMCAQARLHARIKHSQRSLKTKQTFESHLQCTCHRRYPSHAASPWQSRLYPHRTSPRHSFAHSQSSLARESWSLSPPRCSLLWRPAQMPCIRLHAPGRDPRWVWMGCLLRRGVFVCVFVCVFVYGCHRFHYVRKDNERWRLPDKVGVYVIVHTKLHTAWAYWLVPFDAVVYICMHVCVHIHLHFMR
jgi:hypothetical protein